MDATPGSQQPHNEQSASTHSHPPHEPPRDEPSGFFSWVRGLDIQRPHGDRWFAGVASGIARKGGIDPLIVRGVFVVLALLGGPGVLLYVIGWLFLPESTGTIHAEELVRGRAQPGVIVATVIVGVWFIAGLFTRGWFGGFGWDVWNAFGAPGWVNVTFSSLFWIVFLLAVGYLVHLMILQHGKNQQGGPPNTPEGSTDSAQHTRPSTTDAGNEWGKTMNDRANSWSVEYAKRHERLRVGRAQALITVALALIASGATALWLHNAGVGAHTSLPSPSSPVLVAALIAGTAVAATSMIVAGLRGRSTGGVGFLGFLGVAALTVTAVLPWGTTYYAIGDHTLTEATPAAVALVGDTNVDLTVYDTDLQQQNLDITQLLGDITLQLPGSRPTELTMKVLAGSIEARGLDGREQSGVLNHRTIQVNEKAPGPTLHVHVKLLAGDITVE